MTIERFPTPEALAVAVAERLVGVIAERQRSGHTPSVVLTGGTIAVLIHQEVARLAASENVDWSKVDFWWGDERYVAKDSPDRNELQAAEAMLDHLPVDPARLHPMPAADGRPLEDAAEAYAEHVRLNAPARFDIVMLGMGPDGHIASLFPGFPQLNATGVEAVAVTGSPKPPPDRISLTFDVLNRAQQAWFLVTGAGKAEAVERALGGADRHEIPAAGITAPTTWFVDEAAASRL